MFKKKDRFNARKRVDYLLGFCFGAIFTVLLYNNRAVVIRSNDLVSCGLLRLNSAPSIITRGSGKYKRTFLALRFNDDKIFTVSHLNYYCADISEIQKKSAGELLEVLVKQNDLKKVGQKEVEAYGIWEDGINYCDLSCMNSAHNFNETLGIILCSIIGIGCLISTLIPYKIGVKRSAYRYYSIEPIAVIVTTAFLALFLYKYLISSYN